MRSRGVGVARPLGPQHGSVHVSPGVPTKVIGACAGLTAFAIALIAGLAADNPASDVLARALVAMMIGQMVGWVAGAIGERVMREAIAGYREANPVNDSSTGSTPNRADAKASSPAT